MTIDWWTLGIQTVNVVILVWLLGRFFWRPVAAMIEQRRATAQRLLAEAEGKRSEATAALAEIERTRAGFAQEREAILAEAHAAAERARAARLEVVAKEAASLEAAARAAIETRKKPRSTRLGPSGRPSLRSRSQRAWLPVWTARRCVPPSWTGSSRRSGLCRTRCAQAVAANGVTLEAISATPLEPADQQRYRELIGEAFGAHPQITFKADPALIAGLELHGPHLVVTNSWRADLDTNPRGPRA